MSKTPAEQVWDEATRRRDGATEWHNAGFLHRLLTPVFTGQENVMPQSDAPPWMATNIPEPERLRNLLELALAEYDDHFGEATDPNHWSYQARLALRGPVLVTGLEAHECFARYRDLFGEIAHDYVAGAYDDRKRLRANVWHRAYRELAE